MFDIVSQLLNRASLPAFSSILVIFSTARELVGLLGELAQSMKGSGMTYSLENKLQGISVNVSSSTIFLHNGKELLKCSLCFHLKALVLKEN